LGEVCPVGKENGYFVQYFARFAQHCKNGTPSAYKLTENLFPPRKKSVGVLKKMEFSAGH
jgi:hypothetical protein